MAERTQRAKGKAAATKTRARRGGSRAKTTTQPARFAGLTKTIGRVRTAVPIDVRLVPTRTLLTASAAAGVAAVVVYRLLRSGD